MCEVSENSHNSADVKSQKTVMIHCAHVPRLSFANCGQETGTFWLLCLNGSTPNSCVMSLQLLDIVYREETLLNVIFAVTKNGRSILLTAVLAVILIYLFSIIGFIFFQDDFLIEADILNPVVNAGASCKGGSRSGARSGRSADWVGESNGHFLEAGLYGTKWSGTEPNLGSDRGQIDLYLSGSFSGRFMYHNLSSDLARAAATALKGESLHASASAAAAAAAAAGAAGAAAGAAKQAAEAAAGSGPQAAPINGPGHPAAGESLFSLIPVSSNIAWKRVVRF